MNAPNRNIGLRAQKPNIAAPPVQATNPLEKFQKLLELEQAIRNATNLAELKYLLANELIKITSSDQTLIHKIGLKQNLSEIEIVSSMATIDKNAPMLVELNQKIRSKANENIDESGAEKSHIFRLNSNSAALKTYPFTYVLHMPLLDKTGNKLAAISLLKAKPFIDRDIFVAEQISQTASHAWMFFKPKAQLHSRLFSKTRSLIACALVLAAMFIPVPLTILAPIEIVPHNPKVITAPINGVVEDIKILPNTRVNVGDPLFSYNKVEIQSRYEIANRNAAVALAKFRKTEQGAFASLENKSNLALTKAEYEISIAERDYAKFQLIKADVTAPQTGIILFTSVADWEGKPVETGERIMRVADPEQIRLRIEVETHDTIIFENGAEVTAFLDSNPLSPVSASLEQISYQSEKSKRGALVYPLIAVIETDPNKQSQTVPRIGLRGTAQVKGQPVSLWFYLFRKPISAIRQMVGY